MPSPVFPTHRLDPKNSYVEIRMRVDCSSTLVSVPCCTILASEDDLLVGVNSSARTVDLAAREPGHFAFRRWTSSYSYREKPRRLIDISLHAKAALLLVRRHERGYEGLSLKHRVRVHSTRLSSAHSVRAGSEATKKNLGTRGTLP